MIKSDVDDHNRMKSNRSVPAYNQTWNVSDEKELFRVLLLSDTMNFQNLNGKFQGRTRKQAENKWQNIKRKHDQGVVEWKTIMFGAVRKHFETQLPENCHNNNA